MAIFIIVILFPGVKASIFMTLNTSYPRHLSTMCRRMILQARKSPQKSRKPKCPTQLSTNVKDRTRLLTETRKKSLSNQGRYDDMGWMSLVCRHDIPLFFANIDTPGEQQKYAVALILWFFSRIPSNATVTVLYDIGCVLDRSIQMVSFPFFLLNWAYLYIFSMTSCPVPIRPQRSIRYDGNARLRPPMVMSINVQPSTLSRVGV